MGMVKFTLTEDYVPSEEVLAELAALKDRPIDYSDIPPLTEAEIRDMRSMGKDLRKRQMFSLRLQNSTIGWWKKNVGEGYTGVMANLLEEATKNPEWIKKSL